MAKYTLVFIVPFIFLCQPWAQETSDNAAKVAGLWEWSYTADNGQHLKSTLEARLVDGVLQGVYQGARGALTLIDEGRLDGAELSFKVRHLWRDQEIVFLFQGVLSGDRIKGSVEVMDGNAPFDWVATRADGGVKEIDPTGTWRWEQYTNSQITLRRQAGRLSGAFSDSSGRKAPLQELHLIGPYLFFKVKVPTQDGTAYEASYMGKVAGTSITGRYQYKFGTREGTRTWEAKRDEGK